MLGFNSEHEQKMSKKNPYFPIMLSHLNFPFFLLFVSVVRKVFERELDWLKPLPATPVSVSPSFAFISANEIFPLIILSALATLAKRCLEGNLRSSVQCLRRISIFVLKQIAEANRIICHLFSELLCHWIKAKGFMYFDSR